MFGNSLVGLDEVLDVVRLLVHVPGPSEICRLLRSGLLFPGAEKA